MDRKFTATVVRATGSWYDVLHDGETVRCRIRGRLRLKGVRSTNPVVVGDEVACEADEGGDYVIADILPRRNYVIRRASNLSKESHIIAANVDQALLMASLQKPKLLLLDEHTAALDPKTAAKVLELSDRIVEENGLTTMMVTHNMRDAIAHGNRLIMLYNGRIVVDIAGDAKKNITVPELLELFNKASGSDEADDKLLLS